ncbi:CD27 receptor binding [Paramecium bursaria]
MDQSQTLEASFNQLRIEDMPTNPRKSASKNKFLENFHNQVNRQKDDNLMEILQLCSSCASNYIDDKSCSNCDKPICQKCNFQCFNCHELSCSICNTIVYLNEGDFNCCLRCRQY